MKHIFLITVSTLLIGVLAACGNSNQDQFNTNADNTGEQNTDNQNVDDTNNTNPNNTDEQQLETDQDYMKSKMDSLDFSEIEIEISYGKDKEYEAEIEQDKNQPIKAKVEDEINTEYAKGKKAFDNIYSKIENLSLTKNSDDQEAIDQILKAFDLPKDYKKFELEITFNDGSKLDVEDRK